MNKVVITLDTEYGTITKTFSHETKYPSVDEISASYVQSLVDLGRLKIEHSDIMDKLTKGN